MDDPAEAESPSPLHSALLTEWPDCSPFCRPQSKGTARGVKCIKCHLKFFPQGQGPGNGLGRKKEMQVKERGRVLISGGESKVF